MLTTTYKTLQKILLSILLITHKPIKSEFELTPLQLNIIVCITSCCIGATLYALIQKYFYTPPTILPTPNKPKTSKFPEHPFQKKCQDNFKKINSQMKIGYNNQKEMAQLLMKQENTINDLQTQLDTLNREIKIITREHNSRLESDKTLYTELDNFCKTGNTVLPVICALYWAHKSFQQTEQIKLLTHKENTTI